MRAALICLCMLSACAPEISQQRASYDSRLGEAAALDVYRSPGVMKPAVMLVHGDADDIVPVAALAMAVEGLRQAGVPVEG